MNNFDLILNSLPDGLILLNSDGAVVQANATGNAKLTPALKERVERVINTELKTGSGPKVELEVKEDDAVLRIDITTVKNQSDYYLVQIKDITKQHELNRVRRDFVANVSHELKTPITGIKLLADAISQSQDKDPQSVQRFAARLGKETSRLIQLVNDLLDLSKLETISPKFEYFDLAGLVKELGAEYEQKAGHKRNPFKIAVSDNIPIFHGNPEQMELLIINLLDNALRYTPPPGTVQLSLAFDEGAFIIEVEDSGIGIPEKDLARVFERFYRVDKARSRKKGGTGLGLSIVKHVVKNHHGSIEVESRIGSGSKFTVRLPRQ